MRTQTPLLTPAVTARPLILLLPQIPWIQTAPRRCILAMIRRRRSSCTRWLSEPTQGECASLRRRGGRVVLQIQDVHGTAGNKDHAPAAEANSTVQHCWLLPCQRQDKIIYVSDVQRCERAAGNQIWEKEVESASKCSCPRVARQQQSEIH